MERLSLVTGGKLCSSVTIVDRRAPIHNSYRATHRSTSQRSEGHCQCACRPKISSRLVQCSSTFTKTLVLRKPERSNTHIPEWLQK